MKKRIISKSLAVIMLIAGLGGCSIGGKQTSSGQYETSIVVGNWPTSQKTAQLEAKNAMKDNYMKKYPNIEIIPDTWSYDVNTFLPKATSNQLPTTYPTFFTEVKKIAEAGYAADVTEKMKEYGYTDSIGDDIKSLVSYDGKMYAVPTDAYVMGLYVNMNLFKEAGLVNDDGTPIIPQTYDEMMETAKTIKEKTGKAGFAIPTMKNYGGWQFMNLAWSYGVNFMEEIDGKWTATFNSPECIEALKYLRDLKWEHNAMPENALIDLDELIKLYSTDQVAMVFEDPGYFNKQIVSTYKMDKAAVAMGSVPAGPGGRFALLGGSVTMISPAATEEQIDACFKWYDEVGFSPNADVDTAVKNKENQCRIDSEEGYIVGPIVYELFPDSEVSKKCREVVDKYTNVDMKFFAEYTDFDRVTVRQEESQNCQELYRILDSCIQKVLTDKDADVAAVVEQAANDFQTNYLDKIN